MRKKYFIQSSGSKFKGVNKPLAVSIKKLPPKFLTDIGKAKVKTNLKEHNTKGQAIMVNLLLFVMLVAVLISLIPALNAMLNIAQQSDELNCNGYIDNGNPNSTLSYNSSLATNTLACVAIRLYLPYIVLVVLVGGVSKLLASRTDIIN